MFPEILLSPQVIKILPKLPGELLALQDRNLDTIPAYKPLVHRHWLAIYSLLLFQTKQGRWSPS